MPFFGAAFDLPPAAGPTRSYVIASTERSGSMLLCDLLHATGRMGVPTEYFNKAHMMQQTARRLGLARPLDMGRYIDAVRGLRTTGNGMFGAKIHFFQAWDLLAQPAVRRLLAESRFIWLRRRDLMAQATSLVMAMHSGHWYRLREGDASTPADPSPEGGPAAMSPGPVNMSDLFAAMGRIRAENEFWAAFFKTNGIVPVNVLYEDLVADPPAVVGRICAEMGVSLATPVRIEESRFVRQSDPRSERFRAAVTRTLRVVPSRA